MGLSIYLLAGCNSDQCKREVTRINQVLEEEHLPTYNEPYTSQIEESDLPEIEWLYSTSEPLELLAAKFIENPSWILPINRQDYYPISATSHKKIIQKGQSHIVCLPQISGYYVPVYFKSLLLHRSPLLGSSIAFRDELQCLAIKLNLDLGEYTPHFGALRAEREQELEKDAFGSEKWTLLCLYNLAVASIRYSSAIVFGG
ncbi:hypothetical protein NSTCB13_06101 [Nostoc sp. DSM 114160]|jgi:hypothetical protein